MVWQKMRTKPSDSSLDTLNELPSRITNAYLDDGKGTDKKYGNFVLWRQTLDHFTTLRSGAPGPVALVLVTADQKDDRWRKTGAQVEGEPRRAARYELTVEARREAGATLIMLSPTDFRRSAEQSFNIGLSQEIIDSTQATSTSNNSDDSESPLIEDALHLTLLGTRSAEGFDHDNGILVTSGHIRAVPTSTTPGNVLNYRDTLLENGTFEEVNDDTWKLVQPHLFRSASTAAAVMLGRSANGLDKWKMPLASP